MHYAISENFGKMESQVTKEFKGIVHIYDKCGLKHYMSVLSTESFIETI